MPSEKQMNFFRNNAEMCLNTASFYIVIYSVYGTTVTSTLLGREEV